MDELKHLTVCEFKFHIVLLAYFSQAVFHYVGDENVSARCFNFGNEKGFKSCNFLSMFP